MTAYSYVSNVLVATGVHEDRTYFPSTEQIRNEVEAGKVEHGFVDQKGRAVGYHWSITSVINVPFADEAAYLARKQKWTNAFASPEAMVYVEVIGFPTRDGKHYGASGNNVRVATVEEARKVVANRIRQAFKRDHKKFVISKREAA
jgi:hypothetical protein